MKKIIPIRFDGYMQSGGSTKPWRVVAIPADGISITEEAYVVKIFSDKQVSQSNNIGKEFIANALAAQFDLEAPEAFIINLHNDDFKATLLDEPLKVLASKHKGNTFASKLLKNASIMNEGVKQDSFSITDCAHLFAFDCLLLNLDRGGARNKPNLLVDDEGFFLIDHELILPFVDHENDQALKIIIENFNNNNWQYQYQNHLFYPKLKHYRGSKKNLFNTFEELLRVLDINFVEQLISGLTNEGISTGNYELLISYLSMLKQNHTKFCNLLLGLIS